MSKKRMTTAIAAVLLLCSCAESPQVQEHAPAPKVATGTGGVVVSEDSVATEVGLSVLRSGGTAVDAAVATAFALAVTLPKAGNIGGGGFLVAFDPGDREYWALDFRETAPSQATVDMYLELAAQGEAKASTLGALAGGIPGTPAGLYAAWERGGIKDWQELVLPAVGLAKNGFVVGDTLAWDLARKADGLGRFESTRAVFFAGDAPLKSGDRLVQRDLAAVLEAIANGGPRAFYQGPIAEHMVGAIGAAGGNWQLDDLADYQAVFREPALIKLHDKLDITVVAMPPPSSGAAVFAQAIALLRAQSALDRSIGTVERSAGLVEALRLAFADRNRQLGDPSQMSVDVDELLTQEYLDQRAEKLPASPPGNSKALSEAAPLDESPNTTHIIVMDGRGGVVSMTTTLNASFGSKFVIPGTGIMLNNQMDDFDTKPGHPNLYGLIGTGVNKVAPGARMLSSMAPTIVERDHRPWLALGARGGPRILTSVLQVLLHRAFGYMPLEAAVAAPRIHHQWLPDKVYFERCCPDDVLRDALAEMGYEIDYKAQLGRVIAAERLPDGRFVGVVDSRVGGLPATVAP